MPSNIPYIPGYDFAKDTAPQNLINAAALQNELNRISASIINQIDALKVSIRDDDTLTDHLVRIRNLHEELQTYIQSAVEGSVATKALTFKLPVKQVLVTNQASFLGVHSWSHGDRLLLVGQTNPVDNGLWIVQAVGTVGNLTGQWIRATDLAAGTYAGSGWAVISQETGLPTAPVYVIVSGGDDTATPRVGTDPIHFSPVLGTFPWQIDEGGTGATTAAQARINLGVPGRVSLPVVGDGVANTFIVNSGLAALDAAVIVTENIGGREIIVDWYYGGGYATIIFVTPPDLGEAFTVTVIG